MAFQRNTMNHLPLDRVTMLYRCDLVFQIWFLAISLHNIHALMHAHRVTMSRYMNIQFSTFKGRIKTDSMELSYRDNYNQELQESRITL
jgi:hypothetical protein